MNMVGMNTVLLVKTVSENMTMGEKIKDALGNLVVGMVTVFLVLIFIAWVISLFKYISVFQKKMEAKKAVKTAPAAPAGNLSPEPAAVQPAAAASDDEEIAAVIAAAIAAYESESAGAPKLPPLSNGIRINSLRRRSKI